MFGFVHVLERDSEIMKQDGINRDGEDKAYLRNIWKIQCLEIGE